MCIVGENMHIYQNIEGNYIFFSKYQYKSAVGRWRQPGNRFVCACVRAGGPVSVTRENWGWGVLLVCCRIFGAALAFGFLILRLAFGVCVFVCPVSRCWDGCARSNQPPHRPSRIREFFNQASGSNPRPVSSLLSDIISQSGIMWRAKLVHRLICLVMAV